MRPAEAGSIGRMSAYDPRRKLLTVLRGLRHGVLTDFSVSYKLVLSLLIDGDERLAPRVGRRGGGGSRDRPGP